MFYAFIAGILFWQMVTTIAALITDEDEDKVYFVAMGIPRLIFCFIIRNLKKAKLLYVQKNYVVCGIYEKDTFLLGGICIKKKDIKKYYKEGEHDYYIKMYEQTIRSLPYYFIEKIRHNLCVYDENKWFTREWINSNIVKPRTAD